MHAVLGRAFSRTVGFFCGTALVVAGLGIMLGAGESSIGQAARSLLSVVVALGIGVIAASLLPNTMTVSGEKLKPLGLNLNATGGAAFFIVTLVFVVNAIEAAPPALGSDPLPAQERTVSNDAATPLPAPTAAPLPTIEPAEPVVPADYAPAPVQNFPDYVPNEPAQATWNDCGKCAADYDQAPNDVDAETAEQALALGIIGSMLAD